MTSFDMRPLCIECVRKVDHVSARGICDRCLKLAREKAEAAVKATVARIGKVRW